MPTSVKGFSAKPTWPPRCGTRTLSRCMIAASSKQTINGAPYAVHTTDNTGWWACHSSCSSTGCVATATQLDSNNPRMARTPAQSADYRFVDGHWQSAPVQRQLSQPRCLGADGQVVAGANTVLLTWPLEPQPDGTLRGEKTGTALTNECGLQGQLAVAQSS